MSKVISEWLGNPYSPLVALPTRRVAVWKGIEAEEDEESAYRKASKVIGYAGVIEVDDFNVLVLGDEPLPTATLQTPEGIAIVRCVYCKSLKELGRLLYRSSFSVGAPVSECELDARLDSDLVLCDARYSGLAEAPRLPVNLSAPAVYRVLTYVVQLDAENKVLVHRFVLNP